MKALGDLGLGLGLVGVTVQTLQTSLDALDTNIEGQLQTINEGVNKNSTAISTLATSSSDIETRVNYHRMALGDLGLGLWLVGVTIQTLQTSTNDNSTAISTLEKTGNDVETRVNYLSHEGVGRPRFRARVSGCYSLNAPDEFRRTRCKHRRSASNTQ
jgi:methyl-accepting chemotaxis protein